MSAALSGHTPPMPAIGVEPFDIVRNHVDYLVTLPDKQIFVTVSTMSHAKRMPAGAAAAPVVATLAWLSRASSVARVSGVFSGSKINLEQLYGLGWD